MKPESLTVAFMELSKAMDDPFEAFTLPLDTYDPKKPCFLFTIPRELRDMIYDSLISSGNVEILRTSNRLHDESREILYKCGICRLHFKNIGYEPKFSLQKPVAMLIQNVSIEIVLACVGRLEWERNMEQFCKFSGSSVTRQTCRVVLLFISRNDLVLTIKRFSRLHRFLDYLQTLCGFFRLTLEFSFQDPMTTQTEQYRTHWRHCLTKIQKACGGYLSTTLGPSTWQHNDGSVAGYLEFHPRAHLQFNAGTLHQS